MKVNKSNTATIEIEDGDTLGDLYEAVKSLPYDAPLCWIPLGHNKPGLLFNLTAYDG